MRKAIVLASIMQHADAVRTARHRKQLDAILPATRHAKASANDLQIILLNISAK
jgi:hypothetical protein